MYAVREQRSEYRKSCFRLDADTQQIRKRDRDARVRLDREQTGLRRQARCEVRNGDSKHVRRLERIMFIGRRFYEMKQPRDVHSGVAREGRVDGEIQCDKRISTPVKEASWKTIVLCECHNLPHVSRRIVEQQPAFRLEDSQRTSLEELERTGWMAVGGEIAEISSYGWNELVPGAVRDATKYVAVFKTAGNGPMKFLERRYAISSINCPLCLQHEDYYRFRAVQTTSIIVRTCTATDLTGAMTPMFATRSYG